MEGSANGTGVMTRKQRRYRGHGQGAGMGMSKHRKSGISPKGPRLRHLMEIDAKGNDRVAPENRRIYKTVREALKDRE